MSHQSSDMGADEETHSPRGSKKKNVHKPWEIWIKWPQCWHRNEEEWYRYKRYETQELAQKNYEKVCREFPDYEIEIRNGDNG